MTSRRVFSNREWLAALGTASALHVLLAWPLWSSRPVSPGAPAAQVGGLAVSTLSLNGAAVRVLRDSARSGPEPAMSKATPPPSEPMQAVVPPAPRPMTEVAPIRQEPVRDKEASRPEPRRQKLERTRSKPAEPERTQTKRAEHRRTEPKQRKQAVSRTGTATRSRADPGGKISRGSEKTEQTDAARGQTKGAGKRNAGKGRTAKRDAATADRAARPVVGNPRPPYPRSARSRGQEGRVLIRVSVLGSGRVGSATIASSSGHGSLDRAALKAIKRWRFRPALRAGKPVTATLTVPVTFRLEG